MKTVYTIVQGYIPFYLQTLQDQHACTVLVVQDDASADRIQQQLQALGIVSGVHIYPAWDCLPYDRVSPSRQCITQRLAVLRMLLTPPMQTPTLIIAPVAALIQPTLPPSVLTSYAVSLQVGCTQERDGLIKTLSEMGYERSETVYMCGEYAVRGDIIDVFPLDMSAPVRIDFFGDEVERLRLFDPETQRTIGACEAVTLGITQDIILTQETIQTFRQKYRAIFGAQRIPLYEAISEGRRMQGMEHFLPLFYDTYATLLDYCATAHVILEEGAEQALTRHYHLIDQYYQGRQAAAMRLEDAHLRTPCLLAPEQLFLSESDWALLLKQRISQKLSSSMDPSTADTNHTTATSRPINWAPYWDEGIASSEQSIPSHDDVRIRAIHRMQQTAQELQKRFFVAAESLGTADRLHHILHEHGVTGLTLEPEGLRASDLKQGIIVYPLDAGFETADMILVSEQEVLGRRLAHVPQRRRRHEQAILLDLQQLEIGDLVVHHDHGIGCYEGLLTLEFEGQKHDCLALRYAGNDRLFVPVENIDLMSRYGQEGSHADLDTLGSAAWQSRKTRVRRRVYEVAQYLIKLAAERTLRRGAVLAPQQANSYEEFCARFPFPETDDQLNAIQDCLEDMASGRPMDRLVCGDVGFGKTEVALRAAFVAVASGYQVVVIVPTTLLCRQHFETFQERFRGLGHRIVQLSRFITPQQSLQNKEAIADGTAHIIIATHAILANHISFKNLGLVIVDEEQHFGVKQKEKLKLLQKDVHVLTLTATPIPRTLQLALTGVREMSLIKTPPLDRLAVRTFVLDYDPTHIREIILRERDRGGQVFFVTAHLKDLEMLAAELPKLVPEARFVCAHGQMPARALEDVMTQFYDHQYDVLLSTNIVESGIDIASANTLIVYRANLFGLAQLYQLRGRIGRSTIQAFAYFTVLTDQAITDTAQRRLQVIQSLDQLGGGFHLASHDLDIRGTGNIVGEEQSGHIREVGVAFYQTLLQEALMMIRAEETFVPEATVSWAPQINLGISVMIPETYVADLSLRLSLYQKLAQCETREEIDAFAAELVDRFGALPQDARNLLDVMEVKLLCKRLKIDRLDAGPKGLLIGFYQDQLQNPDVILTYVLRPETQAKVRPDHRIFFQRPWNNVLMRVHKTREVLQKLVMLCEKG